MINVRANLLIGVFCGLFVLSLAASGVAQTNRRAERLFYESKQLLRIKKIEAATVKAELAAMFAPQNARIVWNAAVLCQAIGDIGQAIELYGRFLAISPSGKHAALAKQRIESCIKLKKAREEILAARSSRDREKMRKILAEKERNLINGAQKLTELEASLDRMFNTQ